MSDAIATVAALVHEQATYDRYLGPSLASQDVKFEKVLIDNRDNHTSIAPFFVDMVRQSSTDIVILVHPDVELGFNAVRTIVAAFSDGKAGAVGILGWNNGPHYFSSRGPVQVEFLDACLLAVDRRHGIQFDTKTFDTFHCIVDDYCFQAEASGRQILVAGQFHAYHHSVTGLDKNKKQPWLRSWASYVAKLYAKWPSKRGLYERTFPELATVLAEEIEKHAQAIRVA